MLTGCLEWKVGYAGIFANADDNDSHLNSKALFKQMMCFLTSLNVGSESHKMHVLH